jgi:hypothetical protein
MTGTIWLGLSMAGKLSLSRGRLTDEIADENNPHRDQHAIQHKWRDKP